MPEIRAKRVPIFLNTHSKNQYPRDRGKNSDARDKLLLNTTIIRDDVFFFFGFCDLIVKRNALNLLEDDDIVTTCREIERQCRDTTVILLHIESMNRNDGLSTRGYRSLLSIRTVFTGNETKLRLISAYPSFVAP